MIKMSRIKFLLHQECPLWASILHKNKACAVIHVLYIVRFRTIPLKVTSVAKYNPHRKCAFELVNLHTKFDFKGLKKISNFFLIFETILANFVFLAFLMLFGSSILPL